MPIKVGLYSVYHALKNKLQNNHIFNIHNLSDVGVSNSFNTL